MEVKTRSRKKPALKTKPKGQSKTLDKKTRAASVHKTPGPGVVNQPSNLPSVGFSLGKLGRETAFFVLGAIALYMLLCLFSYYAEDPGWTHTGESQQIHNLGGRFGAYFADLLLHAVGRFAFVVPLLIGVVGWRIFRSGQHGEQLKSTPLGHSLRRAAGFVMTVTAGAGLEHMHYSGGLLHVPYEAGGWLGAIVTDSSTPGFGFVGATLLVLTVFVAGFTWLTNLSWLVIMDFIGRWLCDGYERVNTLLAAYRARQLGDRGRQQPQDSAFGVRKGLAKKAPHIEPQIVKAQPSVRVEREKQSNMFAETNIAKGALPTLDLLDPPDLQIAGYTPMALESMSRLVEKTLKDFNVVVEVVAVHPGPVITRFELEPAPGVKASTIVGLARDVARSMSVVSVRVVENIPGKTTVGIEIPNENRETVRLVEGLSSQVYEEAKTPCVLVLGKDIGGEPVIADLTKMPHLLIAGTTGAGKSVCINALILSMIYKATPEEVRMIMIDPKMLELSIYDDIPHLLAPVVTDMSKASNALRWCIVEMDRRFKLMATLGVRNIGGYNRKVKDAIAAGKPIMDPLRSPEDDPIELITLPFIVVVVDELADLMMVVGKKVEELITRIAQRARAAGIHLLLATQRPSVDVVTGLIKANVPSRIAFQVSSRADSRTVLDQMGAEQLLGHGDMLFLPPGRSFPMRVHGSFVSDEEVHKIVEYLKQTGRPTYLPEITEGEMALPGGGPDGGGDGGESDPFYDQAVHFVTETRKSSISAVQRQLRVGYNRAARMIEVMEQTGVVGPLESNGKRAILAPAPVKD